MSKEICILNGTKWILGDESTEPMTWEDAKTWCKSIGQDLPPREVLLMAFLNPEIRSNFANNFYWSSSEVDSKGAWGQGFNSGYQGNSDKYSTLPVRAVRAISAKASEQTEQEPVAWMYDWNIIEEEEYGETRYDNLTRAESITKSRAITNVRPLYTHPPKQYLLDDREKFRMVLELVKKLYMPKVFG